MRPFPLLDLEVGLSGEWGPQDHALDSTHYLWFAGLDLLAHLGALDVKGQFLKGGAPGQVGAPADPNHEPYGLKLHYGGYLELDWMATPLFGFLARGEVRDADVWLGDADARWAATACTSRGMARDRRRAGGRQPAHRRQGRIPSQWGVRRDPADPRRRLHHLTGAVVLTRRPT